MKSSILSLGFSASLLSSSCWAVDLTICANTVAEIEQGIVAASNANLAEDRVVIAVIQGTYDLTNSLVLQALNQTRVINRDLLLLGGYSSNCSQRTRLPTNTVLLNTNSMRRLDYQANVDVTVEGFHWRDFEGSIAFEGSTSQAIQQRIRFSYNRITGGRGKVSLQAQTGAGDSLIHVFNNVIAGRTAGGDNTTFAITGDAGPGVVRAVLNNNTIAVNAMAQSLGLFSLERVDLYNNIIAFNNNTTDIFQNNVTQSLVFNNHYTIATGGAFTQSSGNSTANPNFVNALNYDYRLQSGSSAIDSGINNPPLGAGTEDIANQPRVVGVIDRGPHENPVGGSGQILVSNTNDSGVGSLRAAIALANSTSGENTIQFQIPGSGCPKVITVQSALPAVTDSLNIDGRSQPGFVANTSDTGYNGTLCVAVVAGTTSLGNGLEVPSSAASVGLKVDSIAIGRFAVQMSLAGGRAHRIVGNQIGGQLGATDLSGGLIGISLTADDTTIGGADPSERNIIGGFNSSGFLSGSGIFVGEDSRDGTIMNNFVGLTPTGGARENFDGIVIAGDFTFVEDNVISNSLDQGVDLRANSNNNLIARNRMGLPPLCLIGSCSSAGNRQAMLVDGVSNELNGNLIANSQIAAIRVIGNGNPLLRNQIYDGADNTPPIDIASAGFSPNDNDTLPPPAGNRGQNFPTISEIRALGGGQINVRGELRSANGSYTIQLFGADRLVNLALNGGRCEARTFLATLPNVTITDAIDNNGLATFNVTIPSSTRRFLAATATRREGDFFRDTSEIGPCFENVMFKDGFE